MTEHDFSAITEHEAGLHEEARNYREFQLADAASALLASAIDRASTHPAPTPRPIRPADAP